MILVSLILLLIQAYPYHYKIEFQNGIEKFCPDYKIFTYSEFFNENNIKSKEEIIWDLKNFDVKHFRIIKNILECWNDNMEFGFEDMISCTRLLFKLDINDFEILKNAFRKISKKINKS